MLKRARAKTQRSQRLSTAVDDKHFFASSHFVDRALASLFLRYAHRLAVVLAAATRRPSLLPSPPLPPPPPPSPPPLSSAAGIRKKRRARLGGGGGGGGGWMDDRNGGNSDSGRSIAAALKVLGALSRLCIVPARSSAHPLARSAGRSSSSLRFGCWRRRRLLLNVGKQKLCKTSCSLADSRCVCSFSSLAYIKAISTLHYQQRAFFAGCARFFSSSALCSLYNVTHCTKHNRLCKYFAK